MPNIVPLQFAVVFNVAIGSNPRSLQVLSALERKDPGIQVTRIEKPHIFSEVVRNSFVLLDTETRASYFRFEPSSDLGLPEEIRQSLGVYLIGPHVYDPHSAESIATNIWKDARMLLGKPEVFEALKRLPRVPQAPQARC